MKILSAEQIRQADKFTIENEPIRSINLMERASKAFVSWLEANYDNNSNVVVFCGTGNNGGDGLAIARLLKFSGWKVTPITVKKSAKKSQEFTINYLTIAEVSRIKNIESKEDLNLDLDDTDIIVDAIFGSGLSREAKGVYAETIKYINGSGATVISVDVPSGLQIDTISTKKHIVRADDVVSFQLPKLAFLIPENYEYVKNWHIVDIGLDERFINAQETNLEYIDEVLVQNLMRSRSKFAHKGDFGKVLIISGSYAKMGASVLCTKACMR